MSGRVAKAFSLAPLALGLAAGAITTSSGTSHKDVTFQSHAVVTRDAILHSGPSSSSKRVGSVSEGDVLAVFQHGHRSGFLRVQTADENVGWVSDRYVAPVTEAEVHEPSLVPSTAPPPVAASPSAATNAATPALQVDAGDFDGCPVEGQPSPKGSRYTELLSLNRQKDRSRDPKPGEIDGSVTLDKVLAASHDDTHRWSEDKGAEITAYVLDVKFGGKTETVNCGKGDPQHRDSHIELVLGPDDSGENRRMIVEITPRWQAAARAQGLDWSTVGLQKSIQGHWVKFRGWLFFDAEHTNAAENTSPGNASNWRATAWELHPVTAFTIVPKP